jgi:hypothetical protein
MKKLILLVFLALGSIGYSQTVKQDASGNYIAVKDTKEGKKSEAKATGKMYTDSKGVTYPVYISKNNKLFIVKTSKKTGKNYNYYLNV